MESPSEGGTQTNPLPTSVNPAQDYLAAKGVAFENNDNRLLDLSESGEVQYKDAVQTAYKKLNDIGTLAAAARYTIVLQNNGSVSNNQFIGYDSLIPGDSTPVTIPVNSIFKGFAFSNDNANADFNLEFRKNTTGGAAFHTSTKTNTQYYAESVTDTSFAAGDRIYIKYIDTGDNASDVGLTLFFQATGL